jgi:hypothetical protein
MPTFSSHAYPAPPPRRKNVKKVNKNAKNFKFQNPLTCMYLTQPIFRENLNIQNFDIF